MMTTITQCIDATGHVMCKLQSVDEMYSAHNTLYIFTLFLLTCLLTYRLCHCQDWRWQYILDVCWLQQATLVTRMAEHKVASYHEHVMVRHPFLSLTFYYILLLL